MPTVDTDLLSIFTTLVKIHIHKNLQLTGNIVLLPFYTAALRAGSYFSNITFDYSWSFKRRTNIYSVIRCGSAYEAVTFTFVSFGILQCMED